MFIYGDEATKAQRVIKYHESTTEKEAVKLMRETDKRRRINYNYYTDRQWGKCQNYDLCLNSTSIGTDNCADLIYAAVNKK